MKYNASRVIDVPRATAWQLFDDAVQQKQWQPTLDSVKAESGKAGQPGARSRLVYVENGRRIVMTETITERREPDFMAAVYESAAATTLVVNRFEAIGDASTRWSMWCNFRFKGMMRVISLFSARSIRERNDADMDRFKLLAETRAAS